MSAPSKEEIARIVGVARDEAPLLHLESYTAVASVITHLHDENERLRKTWHIKRCEKWSAEDSARRCRLAVDHETDCDFGELERLRAENERLRASAGEWGDIATSQSESISDMRKEIVKLRAERAECIALLEREASGFSGPAGRRDWNIDRDAMLAKLRGQQP